MNAILTWMSLAGTFVLSKALPMIALTALGILAVQVVLKLVKKMLEILGRERAFIGN